MAERLLATPRVAAAVAVALRDDDIPTVDRLLTELFGSIISTRRELPPGILDEPESTGDKRYDTLLATGLAYALTTRGIAPMPWMEAVPSLNQEWLWDGDEASSPDYREHIRSQTPLIFLNKGLLLRDRDIRIA